MALADEARAPVEVVRSIFVHRQRNGVIVARLH